MKKITVLIILTFVLSWLYSDYKRHNLGDPGRIINSGWGGLEGKIYINYAMIAPFLRADHFLFDNNYIALRLKSQISPVSLNTGAEIEISPIAFLVFYSGFMFGSGWNVGFNGLGRNNALGFIKDKPKEILKEPFYGVFFQSWFTTTFQFDVAALMPAQNKRWSHIVMKFSPTIKYMGVLNVPESQPFEWEAQGGEHFNGWYLGGDYLIGYQIPVIEDIRKDEANKRQFLGFVKHNDFKITLMMWMEFIDVHLTHYFDSRMQDKGWGSDFVTMRFGPNIMFNLPSNFFAMVGFHFRNGRGYTYETAGNLSFMLREYQDWYVYFERIALVFGWGF
ncbi:MAG TPA: hypothetical protein PK771_10350 [Spirochaetota bacterium]|nr:hypothetical protein [Spirochaetota bacterium]